MQISFFSDETIVKHAYSISSSKQIIRQTSAKKKNESCVPPIIQMTFSSCAKQKMVCSSIKILRLFLRNGIVSYINTTNVLISFLGEKKSAVNSLLLFYFFY